MWERNEGAFEWFEEAVNRVTVSISILASKLLRVEKRKVHSKNNGQVIGQCYIVMGKMSFSTPWKEERLWENCEELDPPEDFRVLSLYPSKNDIINPGTDFFIFIIISHPEKPYLRRSIVDGPYKDAQHYLDVQFRLFREDLISPLRNGLLYCKLSMPPRYNRSEISDGLQSSDLFLFNIISIKGIQSRFSNGELLRYLELEVKFKLPFTRCDNKR